MIREEQICRKHDEVEADETEERWRERLARLVQKARADAAYDGSGDLDRLSRMTGGMSGRSRVHAIHPILAFPEGRIPPLTTKTR